MDIVEFLPILSGLALGFLLRYARKPVRLYFAIGLVIPIGVLATITTGEIQTSGLFLLLDIPLVAISTTAGFFFLTLISITNCYADSPVADPSATSTIVLEPMVVTATRTEMKLKDVPASVTVLTKKEIIQSSALTLDDLLRQIPGFNTYRRSSSLVTAPQQDPEAQGVTLRGIGPGGASRALVLLDGVPVNDAFGGWLYWGEIQCH